MRPIRYHAPPLIGLAIAAMLAMFIGGCTSADSDRGSLGETLTTPNIQIGTIFNAGQPLPSVTESSTGFHQPGFDVVMTELESQITAVSGQLTAARESNEADAVAALTERLTQLTQARDYATGIGAGSSKLPAGGIYTLVLMRDVNTPATGSTETASPGDTTQTPTQNTDAAVEVPLTGS